MSELGCCIDAVLTDMGPTRPQFDRYCSLLEQLVLRALVLPPKLVAIASRRLSSLNTETVALVGYPFGAYPLKAKLLDAEQSIKAGADSLEFVLDVDALADGDYEELEHGLPCLAEIVSGGAIGLIADAEHLPAKAWKAVCRMAFENGISYVACTAGFGEGSTTTPELLASLKESASRGLRLKAWQDTGSLGEVQALRDAGASLVGIPTLSLERLVGAV